MHASDVLRQTKPGCLATLSQSSSLILHHGWAAATVRHYAAAVNRFFSFESESGQFSFPITAEAIYDFICWCKDNSDGHSVLSSTTKRYLTGLKMWHVLHDAPFPDVNSHRVRLLFKAARLTEVSQPSKRPGATLMDIYNISQRLIDGSQRSLVLRGVLLVSFWGLARLGEVSRHPDHPHVFIRRKDVTFNAKLTKATIRLRLAKTAAPGEDQFIKLNKQPNCLDPIDALRAILSQIPGDKTNPLFPGDSIQEPVRRENIIQLLKTTHDGRSPLSGHSLRIGGASLRAHYGNPVSSLKKAGRWRSSCYQLYLRKYSKRTAHETSELAKSLRYIE